MGIRKFFHKFKVHWLRSREKNIPRTNSAKRYGNNGEKHIITFLKSSLPNCKIKRNIIISTANGKAEIDCLVLYENKLFAIEIKSWRGTLFEENNTFKQHKKDRWTEKTFVKTHKSPFCQLSRAIHLLKEQNNIKAWITSIVFFENSIEVNANKNNVWFINQEDLLKYIKEEGKTTYNAKDFFDKCQSADFLYSDSFHKSLSCLICENSINFKTPNKTLIKKDIHSIEINHFWSYDELKIITVEGLGFKGKCENGHIQVIDNGILHTYAFCKLDYIEFGN